MQNSLKTKHSGHKRKTAIYLKNHIRTKKKAIVAMSRMAAMSIVSVQTQAAAHMISKLQADKMIDRFDSIRPELPSKIEFPYAKQFDRSIFEALLSIEGCATIRIINAVAENNEQAFIIAAIDSEDRMLYLKMEETDRDNNIIYTDAVADMGNSCPVGYKPPEKE